MHRKAVRSADGAETVVLRDLRFELKPGSFTCLIGPSGCGKTTTLKIILDLDRDYEGTVTLMPAGLRMAAVFKEPRLLPWRTVEQNVRLALPQQQPHADAAPDIDWLYEGIGRAPV